MEAASRQLLAKFEAARSLFEKSPLAGLAPAIVSALAGELNALELRFALATGHLYVKAASGETGRITACIEFSRLLAAGNYAGDVDSLVARAEAAFRDVGLALRENTEDAKSRRGRALPRERAPRPASRSAAKIAPSALAELQRLLDMYPRGGRNRSAAEVSPAEGAVQQIDYSRCPSCDGSMVVDSSRSELRCSDLACGAIRDLVGTVFDDSQFYSQEGQKAKSGTFNPNRHFLFWWMHISACEPEEELGDKDDPDNMYGEKLLAALRVIVVRDGKILRLLTVYDVRAMLREVGRTDLNKNVPLILKKLTGVGPPVTGAALSVRVENLFTKAIEVGELVRRSGRVNRNYYPYYIGKIVEILVPESEYDTRRLLYYIYVQSKETVEADDADWEIICGEIPELTYYPTDRSLGQKYAPS
jgi:hypothetical protein